MTRPFILIALIASLFARDPVVPRVVPPDFEEVDMGLVKDKDTMTVTVSSPCGITSATSRGGLWLVAQQTPISILYAKITKNYRTSHRGDFNGTYKPCNGSGPGEPPRWAGAASAGNGHASARRL